MLVTKKGGARYRKLPPRPYQEDDSSKIKWAWDIITTARQITAIKAAMLSTNLRVKISIK